MFTYICTNGHVELAPSAGDLVACPVLTPVKVRGMVRGAAPCGCGVVRVAQDAQIEAAYQAGGSDAVLALIKARIAAPATATAQAA